MFMDIIGGGGARSGTHTLIRVYQVGIRILSIKKFAGLYITKKKINYGESTKKPPPTDK